MKTRNEVCKIFGISRKTLRGYDEIGLLHPTSKTKNGYWLYNDEAISELFIIQIFVEVGYKRKEIKKILDEPNLIENEYDKVIDMLYKKIDRINNMIIFFNHLRESLTIPKNIISKIDMNNYFDIFEKNEMWTKIKEFLNSSRESEINIENSSESFQISTLLFYLGLFKNDNPQDVHVQSCFDLLYKSYYNLINDLLSDKNLRNSDFDIKEIMVNDIESILSDEKFKEIFENITGSGTIEFIRKSLNFYSNNIQKEI